MNSTFQKGFGKLGPCQRYGCTRKAEHRHHKFPNTKANRKLYGDLMDSKENILCLCMHDHLNGFTQNWGEEEFCAAVGVAIQSKSGQMRAQRESQFQGEVRYKCVK